MSNDTLNLAEFVPYRLSVASNIVSGLIADEYQNRFALKIPEWRVMAVLGEGTPMTQRDLVHATRMDKVTVNRAAKTLVERELLARTPSRDDGRSHHLELSQTGRELYDDIAPVALMIERKLLGVLQEGERETLLAILDKLQHAAERAAGRS